MLVGAADKGVRIGGVTVPMSWNGRPRAGLRPAGAWMVWTSSHSVHGEMLDDRSKLAVRLPARAPDEAVLVVQPLPGVDPMKQFSVDWIGTRGGRTHLATVARLRDLEIASPKCSSLLARMQSLPAGKTLDLSARFSATQAPVYPDLRQDGVKFSDDTVRAFEREVGWTVPEQWGSFTIGDHASMGFSLPRDRCHAMSVTFKVHPYLAKSRPKLDVKVSANGAWMTTWHFDQRDASPPWHDVSVPIRTPDRQCRVDLRFDFSRPGAAPPPYPADEDQRPLQLLFLDMRGTGPAASGAHAQRGT